MAIPRYFGAHDLYLQRTGIAVVRLLLALSIMGLVITLFQHFVDAFLIPGRGSA